MQDVLWRIHTSTTKVMPTWPIQVSQYRPRHLCCCCLQMWTMALRAFDDVKESVRASAAGLLRSLRGISLRLMDRQQTPAAGGERA